MKRTEYLVSIISEQDELTFAFHQIDTDVVRFINMVMRKCTADVTVKIVQVEKEDKEEN